MHGLNATDHTGCALHRVANHHTAMHTTDSRAWGGAEKNTLRFNRSALTPCAAKTTKPDCQRILFCTEPIRGRLWKTRAKKRRRGQRDESGYEISDKMHTTPERRLSSSFNLPSFISLSPHLPKTFPGLMTLESSSGSQNVSHSVLSMNEKRL
jgi:hypothetical protein